MTAAHEEEWALDTGLETPNPNANEANEGQEAPTLNDVEKLAAEMGWKPEADWKGDKSNWTPADEYIRATFHKQRDGVQVIRKANGQIRERERAYDEMQARLDRYANLTNQLLTDQESRHRAEIESYFEAEKKKAAKEGNDDLYDELTDQQRKAHSALSQQMQREPEVNYTQQAQAMLDDPIVGKFLREHPWVVEDEDVYAYAFAVAEDLANAGAPKSAQIRAVKEALRDEYPDRFQPRQKPRQDTRQQDDGVEQPPNFDDAGEKPEARQTPAQDPQTGRFVAQRDAHLYQQRRAPPAVQAGNRLPSSARSMSPDQKAWASLPEEARRTYAEQRKSGSIKMDLVTYAKLYNGEPVDVL